MKGTDTETPRALDAADARFRFFLLYGPDEAGSVALARRLERAMGADAERIDLESPELKSDPSRLADEAASISLFGGKRWIRIQPATDDIVTAVQGLLEASVAGNPVVAIAGALRPTSALVKLALDSKMALAHQSYEPKPAALLQIADALGREAGLRLSRDLCRALPAACSNDRAVMAQEIEKLALFLDAAPDRPAEAGVEDYAAISAENIEGELSRVVDGVMSGHPDRAASELAKLAQSGLSGIPVLRALFKRTVLLAALRKDVDAGRTPADVVEARGKAIFWKEKPAITDQTGRWTSDRLAILADRILKTERALKSSGSAGELLADAELITISRAATRRR